MSGFKTWNRNNNGLISEGGSGNSAGNNNRILFQWSETDTGGSNNVGVLSTTKDVTSSGVITCVS